MESNRFAGSENAVANVGAVWAFMQGMQAYRRRAMTRLSGSPCVVRLTYLGGHPGIFEQEEFWVGRVSDQLRLVDRRGDRWYDLPLERIGGLACDEQGRVAVDFEPTAGLRLTVAFQSEAGSEEDLRKLCSTVLAG